MTANTSFTVEQSAQNESLKKWLWVIQVVILVFVIVVGGKVWLEKGSLDALAFVVTALSLSLASAGTVATSTLLQRALIVVSLLVAAAGALIFVSALKASAVAGPGVNEVSFDFRAAGYEVEGVSAMPCTPQGQGQAYICDVKVLPLKAAATAE